MPLYSFDLYTLTILGET